jgi:hypothetical protein
MCIEANSIDDRFAVDWCTEDYRLSVASVWQCIMVHARRFELQGPVVTP